MSPRRVRYAGVSMVNAGCFDCNGYEAMWVDLSGVGVAARHHDATGHITWADQTISITYGGSAPEGLERHPNMRGAEDG